MESNKKRLTQARLRELLDYDPETGVFMWKVKRGQSVKKGDIAAPHCKTIGLENFNYQKSHLAWLIIKGKLPKKIRFKNNNPYDFSFTNLYKPGPNGVVLSQSYLKTILKYNPRTGVFTWIAPTSAAVNLGDIAGRISTHGYRDISINGKRIHASRLANLYMLGFLPEHEMDHKNRIRHDDRWCNLRHITHSCNVKNCGVSKRNKTGVTGVGRDKSRNCWKVQMAIKKGLVISKRFEVFEDAVRYRWFLEKENNWINCNTTSTAYIYLKERGLI